MNDIQTHITQEITTTEQIIKDGIRMNYSASMIDRAVVSYLEAKIKDRILKAYIEDEPVFQGLRNSVDFHRFVEENIRSK